MKNGKKQGDTSLEEFLEIVRPLGPQDVVLSMIGGNQHAVFSTIQHADPFDFMDPDGRDATDPKASLIPYRVLADSFEKGIRNGDGRSIEALRKATSARVVHVIPPPPKEDNEFIAQFHETFFASEGISSRGVSSPALRLKFWKLQTRVLEQLCRDIGVEVAMPPSKALDRQGFLARDFYANDATHANHHYGELLLRDVESRFLPSGARANA